MAPQHTRTHDAHTLAAGTAKSGYAVVSEPTLNAMVFFGWLECFIWTLATAKCDGNQRSAHIERKKTNTHTHGIYCALVLVTPPISLLFHRDCGVLVLLFRCEPSAQPGRYLRQSTCSLNTVHQIGNANTHTTQPTEMNANKKK